MLALRALVRETEYIVNGFVLAYISQYTPISYLYTWGYRQLHQNWEIPPLLLAYTAGRPGGTNPGGLCTWDVGLNFCDDSGGDAKISSEPNRLPGREFRLSPGNLAFSILQAIHGAPWTCYG